MWGHSEKTPFSEPGNGTLQDTESVGTLILDFLAARLQEINICCLWHSIYSIFVILAQNGLRHQINQIMKKNHMIVFGWWKKIQPYSWSNSKQIRNRMAFHLSEKIFYKTPRPNIKVNSNITNFPSKLKWRCPPSSLLFNIVLEILISAIRH